MDKSEPALFVAGVAGTWRSAIPVDSPPARREGPATSRDAARSMRKTAPTIRARVLAWYIARGPNGGTNEEMADALGLRMQTATARTRELVQLGLVRDSGARRPTTSGRSAIVWRATTAAETPK